MRRLIFYACLSILGTLLHACDPYPTQEGGPFEAIVVDVFMRSMDGNGKFAYINDTVSTQRSEKRTMSFELYAVPKYVRTAFFAPSWSLFPRACALSPLYLPYTLQKFNGSRITSTIAFGNDYPAGADLSPLFELNHWSADGKAIHFKQVLDSFGLDPILSERNALKSYTFKGQTLPGQIARFQWELYLDSDTLRKESAWWQF